jgi:lipopolysaccharide transport system ATP-binding protein
MKKTVVTLENVGVTFSDSRGLFRRGGGLEVLKGVSFEINCGDSVGILGRNGAGKSTLLKLIAGIIAPDHGVVTTNNISSALLNLQIGFDIELSGFDNIYLLGILLGCDRNTINLNMEKIISFSDLGNAIHRPVKVYSAGMKARLGFAVAMELKTDVLLIDEVMGVGDIDFREKSTTALRKKIQSDQTVVLVSHQAPTIKALCNKAVWIENGIVQKEGEVDEVVELYEQYIINNPPKNG